MLIFAHAYFRKASIINNNMALGDNLKKVNKKTAPKMCTDIGLQCKREKSWLIYSSLVVSLRRISHQLLFLPGCFLQLICRVISYPYLWNVHTLLWQIHNFQAVDFLAFHNFMVARTCPSCDDRGVQILKE